MRRVGSKRRTAVLSAIAVLALAAGAYAYWTAGGSGSGSGSVAASNGTITLAGTVTSALFPGGSSPVTLKASNPGATDLQVQSVSLTAVAVDAGHSACVVADFTMPDVAQDVTIANGASNVALPNDGTLSFANTAANQDACKGATLTLTLAST